MLWSCDKTDSYEWQTRTYDRQFFLTPLSAPEQPLNKEKKLSDGQIAGTWGIPISPTKPHIQSFERKKLVEYVIQSVLLYLFNENED